MSEQTQGPQVNGEMVTKVLLEQIADLSKEKAIAVAANQQLQAENNQYLQYAANLEANVKELTEKLEQLENKYSKARTAGPVPVKTEKEPEIIDAEPGE
jgi:uncharacterized protein YgiM (DUF1202 family)